MIVLMMMIGIGYNHDANDNDDGMYIHDVTNSNSSDDTESNINDSGGLDYSGIVRALIANASKWPVAGMLPPRLVRAKLRARSLYYWAGGQYMQQAYESALERTLRLTIDVHDMQQQQQQQQHNHQRRFNIIPSSPFDCRKIPILRPSGSSNVYGQGIGSRSLAHLSTHDTCVRQS